MLLPCFTAVRFRKWEMIASVTEPKLRMKPELQNSFEVVWGRV